MGSAARRVLSILAAGAWLATASVELMAESRQVAYIEASTVHLWKLEEFPARTRTERYRFRVLREYDFDKSRVVDQVLAGPPSLPGVVILQECSVYFPGDLPAYQRMYRGWIERLLARGLRPVIATVVPPARSQGWWQGAKDFVKQRVLQRPSRLRASRRLQRLAADTWRRTGSSGAGSGTASARKRAGPPHAPRVRRRRRHPSQIAGVSAAGQGLTRVSRSPGVAEDLSVRCTSPGVRGTRTTGRGRKAA